MFRYIAGNSIKHALKSSQVVLKKNKIPIVNFAIEESNNKFKIYTEHENLIKSLDSKNKIAIKLSSFEFDLNTINKLIDKSKSKGIQIIIDAEKNIDYEKYQEISNELLFNHNKKNVNVIKTYQMYRKDSYQTLVDDYNFFLKNDIYFGNKMVRGAYWNSEHKKGHLFTSKKETDSNYNKSIFFLSENNIKSQNILATHNEDSINLGRLLNSYFNTKIFEFAHLLGMRESVYKNLSLTQEKVHVYIPYGPYKEMIPYLFRRLYENLDSVKYIFT